MRWLRRIFERVQFGALNSGAGSSNSVLYKMRLGALLA